MKEKFLLHVCCAPCAAHVISLLKDKFDLKLFFYNPNIQPREEYEERLKELEKHVIHLDIPLIKGEYEANNWYKLVKGHENDPEKEDRCKICYKMRLESTAKLVKEQKNKWFGTTLTISPHKDASAINEIGQEIADKYGLNFFEADFKKKDGFKKTMQIACEHDFYRQNYCGCVYGK